MTFLRILSRDLIETLIGGATERELSFGNMAFDAHKKTTAIWVTVFGDDQYSAGLLMKEYQNQNVIEMEEISLIMDIF